MNDTARTVPTLSRWEFRQLLAKRWGVEIDGPEITDALAKAQTWIDRGDHAAIYENHDLGHPELGDLKIVSYGSPAAQLEVDEPPQRLPDIGNTINWRYWLIHTFHGEVAQ